ncbi:MAG: hypothetical protein E5299_01499 [Burkholderia gladioli]|nr:MAG: hypothetical protein E5299_01499 [Burkholderia gladioli]
MTKEVFTEVIREVWIEGARIRVSQDEELSGVLVTNEGHKDSEDWFGSIRFTMTYDFAKALGEAIIAAAEEGKA